MNKEAKQCLGGFVTLATAFLLFVIVIYAGG